MTFFFHYNKPASAKAGKAQISVHHKGVCHIVDNVVCLVMSKGRIRERQPKFVMTGTCRDVAVIDRVAYIR